MITDSTNFCIQTQYFFTGVAPHAAGDPERGLDAVELQKRMDNIAEATALMTVTTVTKKFIDGLADTIPGHTGEKHIFADILSKTYPGSDQP